MLDRDYPEVVLERSEGPILEPVGDCERSRGTPNVVFSCGAIISEGKLVLSYAAADKVIGVPIWDLPGEPI